MSCFKKALCLLLCGLLALALCACEGEPAGKDDVFPKWENSYTMSDFEDIRFRCTAAYMSADGQSYEKETECTKEDSVALYNLLNRGEWTEISEQSDVSREPLTQPMLMLSFSTGDTTKAKNCYGIVWISEREDVVWTPSETMGAMTPYVAPAGTYAAVKEKMDELCGN